MRLPLYHQKKIQATVTKITRKYIRIYGITFQIKTVIQSRIIIIIKNIPQINKIW